MQSRKKRDREASLQDAAHGVRPRLALHWIQAGASLQDVGSELPFGFGSEALTSSLYAAAADGGLDIGVRVLVVCVVIIFLWSSKVAFAFVT